MCNHILGYAFFCIYHVIRDILKISSSLSVSMSTALTSLWRFAWINPLISLSVRVALFTRHVGSGGTSTTSTTGEA